MRLGIFGGTFDPIHVGHLIVAEEIRQALALSRILFLPAGQPPHKQGWRISSVADRVAMTRLAVADNPAFEVCLHDAERVEPAYTADTLAALGALYPGVELFFVMGEDSLVDLPTWRSPERILELARLAVAARPGVSVDLAALEQKLPGLQQRLDLVETLNIGIAARDLRQRVSEGRPIRYQVPAAVEEYIHRHRLYLP